MDKLYSELYGQELYDELLQNFSSKVVDVAKSLNALLKSGDYTAIQMLGHRMAGTSATYGYPDLAEVFTIIEKKCLDGVQSPEKLKPLVRELDELVLRVDAVYNNER